MNKYALITSLIIFFMIALLSLDRLFSTVISVNVIDPAITARPIQYRILSFSPLLVRAASPSVSGSTITSVSVTIYNSGTRPAGTTIMVYVYDDGGNVIGSGSYSTPAIPARQSRTYSVSLSPQPSIHNAGVIEVSLEGAL